MTHLQVCEISRRLVGGETKVRLEEHERDGLAGNNVAAEQLREEGDCEPLVRDGADDADWDEECDRDDDRDDEEPDGEVYWEDLDTDCTADEAEDEEQAVPPHRNFRVGHHEARVHIMVVPARGAELAHDIATVPNYGATSAHGRSEDTR